MTLLTELTTGPLASELAPFVSSGEVNKINEILNRKDISVPGTITAHDIKQYFSLIDVRLAIMDSSALSCRAATQALIDFPVFDLTIPDIAAAFDAILSALVAETLIPDFTETHKQTILFLAQKKISRAEQAGILVNETLIKQAIWTDEGERRI